MVPPGLIFLTTRGHEFELIPNLDTFLTLDQEESFVYAAFMSILGGL